MTSTKNISTNHLFGQNIVPPKILSDRFGRKFDYLRIAVNEKCNLRCIYCMPEEGIPFQKDSHLLSTDEIYRLIKIVARLGVTKIRFTGGEPLLRKDIFKLIDGASKTKGIKSVHLTTNGLLLESKIFDLVKFGLNGVNISLDTLKSNRFKKISRRSGLKKVLRGIDVALSLKKLKTKINVVIMRNFNLDELKDFAELTKENNVIVRFIELMPFDSKQIWKTGNFCGFQKIIDNLSEIYPEMLPTNGTTTEHEIYKIPGYKGKIAVIPAYSRNLCGACNRIRITADGKILNCLFSGEETDIMKFLRKGSGDDYIAEAMSLAMMNKLKNGWEAQRSRSEKRDSMTQIGG
tara:strand:+ start:4690 stop:5733 length:1044 start_codon:yes stop_codon:yes gene_type:complete